MAIMSDPKKPSTKPSAAATPPAKDKPKPESKPKPPRARRSVLAPLALLLALLALAAVAFGGWQWWHGRQARHAQMQSVTQLDQRVASLEQSLTSQRKHDKGQQAALERQWQADSDATQQQLSGLNQRTRQLEGAVNHLAQRGLGDGQHALLLDQVQMLLRMAGQRYALFHDGAEALKAYAMADKLLASVDDPALTGVREAIKSEREALAATHPATRASDLATLAHLRSVVVTLPLKPLDKPAPDQPTGFWQRVWRALSTAVVVQRIDDSPQTLAASGLARQLTALDLAQAEAARMAGDGAASQHALQRASHALDARFDGNDAAVIKVQDRISQLASQPVSGKVVLGDALRQLENQRGVQAANDDQSPAPASAASASVPATSAPVPVEPASAASGARA